jgi:predicted molibdopterin-dependent oxidoreductase YjgC
MRGAAPLFATGGNGAIYYGLGVTEHAQGSTMVIGIANLAMADRQRRPRRRRRESAARPEQRAGFLRHGLLPA